MNVTIDLYKEPLIAKYIHVDPETNTVHLLVPVVGGTRIAVDNTCKAVKAMAEFFGLYAVDLDNPRHVPKPALPELRTYKAALEHDIALALDPLITQQKQQRLAQINAYIQALETIGGSYLYRSSLTTLHGGHPIYPYWITPLFSAKTNLFSMHLRPESIDVSIRFPSPVFSVYRSYFSTSSALYSAMHSEYGSLNIKKRNTQGDSQNPRQLLTDKVVRSQAGEIVNFGAIQRALTIQTKKLFDVDVDFDFTIHIDKRYKPNGTFISQVTSKVRLTQGYIDRQMYFDETATVEDYVDALLGNCAQELWDTLATSPFSIRQDASAREKLIILTQFFLAELNIHCYAKDLSIENFGVVLDSNPLLCREIILTVKAALASGRSVERALFDFINERGEIFGLVEALDDATFSEIQTFFVADYNTISQSPHFDEFAILVDKPGELNTHQGAICVDFAHMITLGFPGLDNDYFRQVRNEQLPHTVPHKNGFVNELSDTALAERLISLVTTGDIRKAASLLLAATENQQQVFERLDASTIQTIMSSSHWGELLNHIERCLTQRDRPKFHNHFKMVHTMMTNSMITSLYYATAANERLDDPVQHPGFTENGLKELLAEKYGLQYILSIERKPNGCLITIPDLQNERLTALLRDYENKLYCTPTMVETFYQEAVRIHGEGSEQIARINAPQTPYDRLRATLELLRIPVQEITFPAGTPNAVIHVSSSAGITMMTNILRYPTLRPDEQMGRFNAAVEKLELHAMDLESKKHWASHQAALTLIDDLKGHGNAYFLEKTIDYPRFKELCRGAVESKREALEVHYGWAALLEGILYVVNTLIYTLSLFTTSNFFKMPSTESVRKIDQFKDGLEIAFNQEPIGPS